MMIWPIRFAGGASLVRRQFTCHEPDLKAALLPEAAFFLGTAPVAPKCGRKRGASPASRGLSDVGTHPQPAVAEQLFCDAVSYHTVSS